MNEKHVEERGRRRVQGRGSGVAYGAFFPLGWLFKKRGYEDDDIDFLLHCSASSSLVVTFLRKSPPIIFSHFLGNSLCRFFFSTKWIVPLKPIGSPPPSHHPFPRLRLCKYELTLSFYSNFRVSPFNGP